jgi:hypothetical protein
MHSRLDKHHASKIDLAKATQHAHLHHHQHSHH